MYAMNGITFGWHILSIVRRQRWVQVILKNLRILGAYSTVQELPEPVLCSSMLSTGAVEDISS